MLIIIISRVNLKLGHVGSKTRLRGQQATQVSDLGPLWPSCFSFIVCICFKFKEKLIFKNQNHVFFGFLWCPSLMSSPELCTGEDINLGHSPVQ